MLSRRIHRLKEQNVLERHVVAKNHPEEVCIFSHFFFPPSLSSALCTHSLSFSLSLSLTVTYTASTNRLQELLSFIRVTQIGRDDGKKKKFVLLLTVSRESKHSLRSGRIYSYKERDFSSRNYGLKKTREVHNLESVQVVHQKDQENMETAALDSFTLTFRYVVMECTKCILFFTFFCSEWSC